MTGSLAWTDADDDRSAFEEAMDVADVALRHLQAEHARLRTTIEALAPVSAPERDNCLAQLKRIDSLLETPPITKWRQQHSQARGRKRSQVYVLERKMDVARQLLANSGINLDSVHVRNRSPRARRRRREKLALARQLLAECGIELESVQLPSGARRRSSQHQSGRAIAG